MSDFKVQSQASALERIAYEQRLKKLGLIADESGKIDPASAESLKETGGEKGVAALEKVATGGVLTLDSLTNLHKSSGFLASLRGRDPTISEQHTNALRSVAMSCDGFKGELEYAVMLLSDGGKIDPKRLDSLSRRSDQVARSLQSLLAGEVNLAACAPDAVRALAKSAGDLAHAVATYTAAQSDARKKAFAKGALDDPDQRKVLIDSLLQSATQLDALGTLARAIGASNIHTAEATAGDIARFEDEAKQAKFEKMTVPEAVGQVDALTAEHVKANASAIEKQQVAAEELKARGADLKEKLPDFNKGGVVATLAALVKERWNGPESGVPKDQSKMLVISTWDAGSEKAIKGLKADTPLSNLVIALSTPDAPHGQQKLVLGPNGLRVIGVTKWSGSDPTARVPDPAELANAGWSIEKLDKTLGELAKKIAVDPDSVKPIQVKINRSDELHTEGLKPNADMTALMAELEKALNTPVNQRGSAVVAQIQAQAGKLSPGEYREYAVRLMERVAGTSVGGGHRFSSQANMKMWFHPEHMVAIRDAVRAGFKGYKVFDVEKGDYVREFLPNTSVHSAMKDLFYATETGTVSYKAYDPLGKDAWGRTDYGEWCQILKHLKPYRPDQDWY